jgi:protoheme IX farnesyltransferase
VATSSHQLQSPVRTVVADYVTLTKPRIMLLILITAYGAMAYAADGLPPLGLTVATLVGLGLSSGGASALNHYFDRDIDALMTRTAVRPIPSGRVAPEAAFGFGVGLLAGSMAILTLDVNALTAGLALGGALFYVIVYTMWLKRRTPQNIVIGGAAGAVPPLVGWAAVTGRVELPAIFMFAIIFYWTPPHFWALSLLAKDDYAKAGIPMLPVVRGERETARQILLYTVLLVGVTVLPWVAGSFGNVYMAAAGALGAGFLYLTVQLVRDTSRPMARHVFVYSLAYLALLFAAIGIDRIRIS